MTQETTSNQKLIFTNRVGEAIDTLVASAGNPSVYVLVDTNTAQYVLPVLEKQSSAVQGAHVLRIAHGEQSKSLETAADIWRQLDDAGATRSSIIINVGGGVVTDLGAFVAATFKRGMKFINLPTTLMGAVDASVGGKNGINFNGTKNQIGTFAEPMATIITTDFLVTLPQQQLLDGYAEMIKHALLESDDMLQQLLAYSVVYPVFDPKRLEVLLADSIAVKQRFVAMDPTETTGPRKALNLGHTVGHAFEALAWDRKSPVAHGFAVAQGLIVALILSHLKLGFAADRLHAVADYIKTNYNAFNFTCDDYPRLLEAMRHDKKNTGADTFNFTLLEAVGKPVIDVATTADEVRNALDIYRDMMGI